MTTIAIPNHTYQRIAALAALRNLTPDALAADALEQLARQTPTANGHAATPPNDLPDDEWVAQWRAWAGGMPQRAVTLDDSRESIYGDRG